MASLRHLWFDSRHLLGDESGRRLLANLDTLDPKERDAVLSIGDRLAHISLTLAQAYCRSAVSAWRTFAPRAFTRWVRVGERLAATEPVSREGASAYFGIDPQALSHLGLEVAEGWTHIGREVLSSSRRLGTLFLQTTAPLLPHLAGPPLTLLQEWATQGLKLLRVKGWKGEFLAVSYFEAAAVALSVLSYEEFGQWARLGGAVQESGPWTFFSTLPPGFAGLPIAERLSLLRTAQDAAALSPQAAEDLYRHLPQVLSRLTSSLQPLLLRCLAPVARIDPVSLPPLLPHLVPTIKGIPASEQEGLFNRIEQLAEAFPTGVPPLLRSLNRAYEEAGKEKIAMWLEKGEEIAQDNPHAGVAFFALESSTSLKVLRHASPGVDLEEVGELLRKYIHMLSGTSAGIQKTDRLLFPPPLETNPTSSGELPLPARVDLFPTYEENFRLYRILAAHQAGRREFGTYDFSLAKLWPLLPDAVQKLADPSIRPSAGPSTELRISPSTELRTGLEGELSGGLEDYFSLFSHPEIIEVLFLFIEAKRISARLSKAYRGLENDLAWIATLSLPHLLPPAFVSLLSSLSLRSRPNVDTTVYDSVLQATEFYLRFLSILSSARSTREGSFPALLMDKATGDALLDPEPDDNEPPGDLPELPKLELNPEIDEEQGGSPLSPEELKALIEAGVDLQIRQGKGEDLASQGLYISDLLGKLPSGKKDKEVSAPAEEGSGKGAHRPERDEALFFFYNEWDYLIADYRPRWCRLREITPTGDSGEFFNKTLSAYVHLMPTVKHEFQRIRPEMYRVIRGLEDGEDFDLNATVTAAVDIRARITPSSKLYTARRQTERDVAALFLLDMSASTDEPLEPQKQELTDDDTDDWLSLWKKRPMSTQPKPRRIIDVTKEALVIMSEALEEIGDTYAIYGFSGHGRDNVEFYHVKSFSEGLSPAVKGRIGAIEPKRSTRMGAALRHAVEKMKDLSCRVKLLVLLSDGFPQDVDYGSDRRSITHGLRDTMIALKETEREGILPFCLTVDKAGHDYLREMCQPSRYLVIEDIASLPSELPKIYQRYIRPHDR